MIYDRLPPYSQESEQGILGCILDDHKTCIPKCIELLSAGPETFYDLRHQQIYRAILELNEESIPVDIITLHERLKQKQILDDVGGIGYISNLQDVIPSSANLPNYVDAVNRRYIERKIIAACAEVSAKAYECSDTLSLLDEFEQRVMSIRPSMKKDKVTIKELVHSAIGKIETLFKTKGSMQGIPTGLIDLDKRTGGLHKGEVTVIAGYPGSGKTSLAMNIVEHSVVELGKRVGVFSLEMSAESLVFRFLCSRARTNLRDVNKGYLNEADFPKLVGAAGKISKANVWFEDGSDLSIYEIRSKARTAMLEMGLDMVVIDYLQLLTASGGSRKVESRQQEVAEISRCVKAMARELNIPVIALSQLNDDGQLRESRAIGQDADNIWVLDTPDPEDEAGASSVLLRIRKARNGPVGKVTLTFLREFTRFENAADE